MHITPTLRRCSGPIDTVAQPSPAPAGGSQSWGDEGAGEKEEEYHRDLGRLLKNSGISLILLLGEETKAVFDEIGNGRARFFEDRSSLIDFASSKLIGRHRAREGFEGVRHG